jgi:hypothetical protein
MSRARMFRDQWGNTFFASSVRELRAQIGGGGSRVSPMYVNDKAGATYRTGYVVGPHWLEEWAPVRACLRHGQA